MCPTKNATAATPSQKTTPLVIPISPGAGATPTQDTFFENRIARLCGRWILGKRSQKDHIRDEAGEVLLYRTDQNLDMSNWVQILMVSQGCTILPHADFVEMNLHSRVMMKWPEHGAATTRYMHQISDLLWVVHEVLMEDGALHMIDPYVVEQPR